MASMQKKIRSNKDRIANINMLKALQKKKPVRKVRVVKQEITDAVIKDVIKDTLTFANSEIRQPLCDILEIIANMFSIYLLVGWFNVRFDDIVKFKNKHDDKEDAVIRCDDVTFESIMKYEIVTKEAGFNSLRWNDYKPEKFNPDSVSNKLIKKVGKIEDIRSNTLKVYAKGLAYHAFANNEIICISALHDALGWGRLKCEFFSAMYRCLWDSQITDIYDMLSYLVDTKGIPDGGQRENFKKMETLWGYAFY